MSVCKCNELEISAIREGVTCETCWVRATDVRILQGKTQKTQEDNTRLFGPAVINTDAVKALSNDELDTVLAILTKAGY